MPKAAPVGAMTSGAIAGRRGGIVDVDEVKV